MIMALPTWISAPFSQGVTPAPETDMITAPLVVDVKATGQYEPSAPQHGGSCAPRVTAPALPVAPGHDDSIMIAESRLRQHHRDGTTLATVLRTLVATSPAIGARVIMSANLGRESERMAAVALREFARTGVPVAPVAL